MQSIANLNERTTGALGELPIRLYVTHVPRKSRSTPSRWKPSRWSPALCQGCPLGTRTRSADGCQAQGVGNRDGGAKSENDFVDDYW